MYINHTGMARRINFAVFIHPEEVSVAYGCDRTIVTPTKVLFSDQLIQKLTTKEDKPN